MLKSHAGFLPIVTGSSLNVRMVGPYWMIRGICVLSIFIPAAGTSGGSGKGVVGVWG